jgi:hypothetical protein
MLQVVFDDDSDQEAGQCKLDMLELNRDQAPQRLSLDFSNSSSKDPRSSSAHRNNSSQYAVMFYKMASLL